MGETPRSRFDEATEQAWTRFRARLADRVADMEDGDVLVVGGDRSMAGAGTGWTPHVRFRAYGGSLVRCEVSSNEHLTAGGVLDEAAVATVLALGWNAPTLTTRDDRGEGSAGFHLDAGRSEADRLAVMTTRVLREVFGLPHPAFLEADGLERDVPDAGAAGPLVEGSPEAVAIRPRDVDHLRQLVDEALLPLLGRAPEHDEEDDIPVPTRSSVVFVRVRDDMPVVQLFSFLVYDVADTTAARFEVSVLNRDERFFKFSLAGDSVMMELDFPALPFAPAHLRDLLGIMCAAVDRLHPDLQERIGGELGEATDDEPAESPEDDPEAETDALHPAMLTLLELDADRPGSVTAEMAASVCSWDRELILELITWNCQQEIAWRQARDRARTGDDADEADVCEHERHHAEESTKLLRRALRLVVETQLAKQRWRLSYSRPLSEPAGRESVDLSLPGLDLVDRQPGLFDVE